MKLYKLTDEQGRTFAGTQWAEGVEHEARGQEDLPLCSDGWIHAYENLLVGVMMNPIHADFKNPRAWEAEGEVGLREGELKCGCRKLRVVREVPVPEVTTEQRVRFAIGCGWDRASEEWRTWARKWLSGEDGTEASEAAARAAWAVARAAWAAEAARAADAAWAADAEKNQTATLPSLARIAAWAMSEDSIEKLYAEEK